MLKLKEKTVTLLLLIPVDSIMAFNGRKKYHDIIISYFVIVVVAVAVRTVSAGV